MSDWREQSDEAGAKALYRLLGWADTKPDWHSGDAEHVEAHAVVDAVEPIIRADERERVADLIQMKFSMTSARSHGECVCHLCAINSTVDAAVDWLKGEEEVQP